MQKNNKQPEGGLLQSREWMTFLRAENKKIIEISDGDCMVFGTEQDLPVCGSYIYFPRVQALSQKLCNHMSNLRRGWVRCDIVHDADLAKLRACGKKVVKAPHDMQPREHLIIDITKDSDALLAQMKSKTRYNVRLAQKKGVSIIVSHTQKDIDCFYDLIAATADRKDVTFHDKMHYEKILHTLPGEMIALYSAYYDNRMIASNLVSFYNGTATYLHGATSDAHRNVMAPFLLQWQIISDAKKRGCVWYDFGGVFPDANDPGKKGITRFKRGFAPHEKLYTTLGSYDMILSSIKYNLYRIMRKLR